MDQADPAEPKGLATPSTPRPLGEVLASGHLPVLDGLRTVAVFVVMVFHHFDKGPADLGVSIFFVLSGFLITWLLLKERAKTGTISLRKFFVRRTLRIFPAYYVYLALCIAIAVGRGRLFISKGLVLCALTYTVNYYEAFLGGPVNFISHGWSLAQEEQFYLLWPLAFLALARGGPRTQRVGLCVAIAATVAWRTWLYLSGTADAAYVYHAFDTRFDNLAVGCLLALVAKSPRFLALGTALARRAWMPLVTVGLLLASRLGGPERYHYTVGLTVDAVLCAVGLVQLIQLGWHPLWRWLEHPLARYLGALSYSLYLYHGLAWSLGARLTSLPPSLSLVATLLASIVLAMVSYHLVEKPFVALKGRFAV